MKDKLKIGIHERPGSASDKWISYCILNSIPYKIVNCYQSDIIEQLEDCSALMWHHHHHSFADKLFAKQLTFSVEQAGKKVFPNFNTSWHFDDKLGQKYLLEAIHAPVVPTYSFFQKKEAKNWAKNTQYPKVFKLRNGAGSSNVQIVENYSKAAALINKAFGKGFLPVNRWHQLKEAFGKLDGSVPAILKMLKGVYRIAIPGKYVRMQRNERGYVYFQDFIPNNDSDLRVIVVGEKAFAAKRMVRKGDFRASGSGKFNFDPKVISTEAIKIAFNTVKKLNSQCLAFDFVFDKDLNPLILELSYGFCTMYDNCNGYWDSDLNWIPGSFSPQELMIESVLERGRAATPEYEMAY